MGEKGPVTLLCFYFRRCVLLFPSSIPTSSLSFRAHVCLFFYFPIPLPIFIYHKDIVIHNNVLFPQPTCSCSVLLIYFDSPDNALNAFAFCLPSDFWLHDRHCAISIFEVLGFFVDLFKCQASFWQEIKLPQLSFLPPKPPAKHQPWVSG